MRKLLKKDAEWDWTPEIDEDFKNLKKEITEAPCLAHFDPKKDNYITTDACNTGLGATLWQKEGEIFKPVAFASRYLTDCKKICNKRIRTTGSTMGVRVLQVLCIREKSKPINKPPSTSTVTKKEPRT